MIVTYFKKALDAYDPYGMYRVNAFQCFLMISTLFIINSVFNLSNFSTTIFLPVFGSLAICMTNGYDERLKAMFIYSVATIGYALILSVVSSNRGITVIVVGIVIVSFFELAKKRKPQLLVMIPLIHISAYTVLCMPFFSGTQLVHWCLSLSVMAALSIGLLALFPRIYFFRIWLRVVHFTLAELEERLITYQHTDLAGSLFVFQHFRRVPTYTAMLNYKEHGFAARRISLKLTSIYITMTALIHQAVQLNEHELQEIRSICRQFGQALIKNQPLDHICVMHSDNRCFLKLHDDICYILRIWNQLCLKL